METPAVDITPAMITSTVKRSSSFGKFATALAEFQKTPRVVERNREVSVKTESGSSYTFMYATLDAIVKAIAPDLAAAGLSYIQMPSTRFETVEKYRKDGAKYEVNAAVVTVTTLILHTSGEWIESQMSAYAKDDSPQSIGSVTTYLRRYSLCLMLGIVAEEDDDANSAQGNTFVAKNRATTQSQSTPAEPKQLQGTCSAAQGGMITRLVKEGKVSVEDVLNIGGVQGDDQAFDFSRVSKADASALISNGMK